MQKHHVRFLQWLNALIRMNIVRLREWLLQGVSRRWTVHFLSTVHGYFARKRSSETELHDSIRDSACRFLGSGEQECLSLHLPNNRAFRQLLSKRTDGELQLRTVPEWCKCNGDGIENIETLPGFYRFILALLSFELVHTQLLSRWYQQHVFG